jgi:hypothetical protein
MSFALKWAVLQIVPNLSAGTFTFEDISVKVQLLYEEIGEFMANSANKGTVGIVISVSPFN